MALSIPATIDAETDALAAALAYARAGWYVLPLARATKHPGSVLGSDWNSKSSRDAETLVSWFAGTDYGVALHVGRSGGVVLDIDHPEAMPDAVRDAVAAGAPFQSTRPDIPFRGHALFDADGVSYSNSTGGLGVGWGDVRGKNGIIVVAPSEHPSGGVYEWLQTGEVPRVPASISSALRRGGESEDAATDAEVSAFCDGATGDAKPRLLDSVLQRFEEEVARGGSRHQAAVSCAAQIAREATAGMYPADSGFQSLAELFVTSIKDRATTAQGMAELHGIVAWAVAQARSADADELRESIEARTSSPGLTVLETEALGHEFWSSRPELAHIRTAAHSRGASADAVLHATLARIAAMQNPRAQLDVGLGPIGLNYFTTLIGPSGAGKSQAIAVANDLVPVPLELGGDRFRDGVPPGSGEGLAEMFMGMIPDDPADPKSKKYRGVARQNAFVTIDEGEMLTRLGERSGSTFGVVVRSAFSCSTLGQQNATDERTRIVPRGAYSMGMVIGFQPSKMGGFFDEAEGGTPQRFTYASALDPSIPDRCDRLDWPGPLRGEGIGWPAHWYSVIPIEAGDKLDALDARRTAVMRGLAEEDPLDAHSGLVTARLAALLFILSGRAGAVSVEDWELAETLWRRSRSLRDGLIADERQRREDAQDAVIERQVKQARRVKSAETAVVRVARWVARKADGTKRNDLYKRLASRDRDHFDEAAAYAEASGWVKIDEDDSVTSTA